MTDPRSVYWVNAFTQTPFAGNPAVVLPDASGLSDEQMQLIAREMNCSETAFVLRPTDETADFRLRWFTPTQEVPLCGHATVATLHVMAQLGLHNLKPGYQQFLYVETLSGVLAVTVDFRTGDAPWIWLTLPACSFQSLELSQLQDLTAAFPSLESGFLAGVVDSLNQDAILQVPSLQVLQNLQPDFARLEALGQQHQWRGFSVFTTETEDPTHVAQSRFFAPQSGINEDPVTGSASGPLALYLQQMEWAKGDRLILEQGQSLNRPGLIAVDLAEKTPRCGGQAVTVLIGEIGV